MFYRDEVHMKINDTKKDLGAVTQALKAYEGIGLGFDNLVREYTVIREEIDNKKWALRELKHLLDTEGVS